MAARGAVLGIGRLLSLDILDPKTGRSRIVAPANRYLAWSPKKRCYHICWIANVAQLSESDLAGTGQTQPKQLPVEIRKAHQRFHSSASQKAVAVMVPTPVGKLRQIGLLKALVYKVPKKIRSPSKKRYNWHHAFGDTGHEGRDDYSHKVMPAVLQDRKGNWFIRRRPGNIFTVDTWLRG